MKRHTKTAYLSGLFSLALLAMASMSWGTALSVDAQIDTFTITSSLGITFGDFNTSVSGNIYSNGTPVASGNIPGAGSFITGADGSAGPLATTYLTSNQGGYLGTLVSALPAAINPDPSATPLASDFYVLANTNAISEAGGKVTATDTASYSQTFTINGTGAGTMNLGAVGLYNFMIYPDGIFPFTAKAEATLDFILSGGANQNYHALITNPLFMTGTDILLLGSKDPTGLATPGELFGPIAVSGGQTWTLTATANSLAEINSVPEPGTFVLAGCGLLGLVLFRKRMAKTA